MTIAGSDSGGGAGIQADLKTFSALGVYGTCAVTAVTAQNTKGVLEIFPLPPDAVKKQIEAVAEDIAIEFAKTGMLYSKGIMEVVAESIDRHRLKVIVDPVLQAGTGDSLASVKASEALIKIMVPRAHVLTPNVPEAETIANLRIKSLEDMKTAAQRIQELGANAVVIKGGHLKPVQNKIYDGLYFNEAFKVFEKPRLDVKPHGGGCSFSAAIAAHLALGANMDEAVEKSEKLVDASIKYALRVGDGRSPVNPLVVLYNDSERFRVIGEVEAAARMIEASHKFTAHIAEVGTQVAMAVPYAVGLEDVTAIEGRIVKLHGVPKAIGAARFGVSRHIASIILTAMKFDPQMRAALNLHYSPKLAKALENAGLAVASFDRALEPPEIKTVEGSSLSWGTEAAIKAFSEVPDAIFDAGEVGKEPMIRVLGRTATEVVAKAMKGIQQLK
jgi:hydroxymethylpyrimidine kinase/phosphomethylpyrimidine kinase